MKLNKYMGVFLVAVGVLPLVGVSFGRLSVIVDLLIALAGVLMLVNS